MPGRFLRELTIRQLRALTAVQKHRSVTAAAKQLHLTQPAVTLQLRNLQALAGLPLIQRTGDGMLLTDAGREVLSLAGRIEAAIADCATSLEMMAGKTAGRISIGAVSTAKYFVPFMISGFSKLHPNIDVTLSIGNRQEIGTALRGYDLDFAIMGRPPADIDMDDIVWSLLQTAGRAASVMKYRFRAAKTRLTTRGGANKWNAVQGF